MKNFSDLLNGSFNFSNLTDPYACECSCGVLADNFTFGAINLFLVIVVFYLWNKHIYTKRYSLNEINNVGQYGTILYIIDKFLLALFFLNLASVFYALALPLVFGL